MSDLYDIQVKSIEGEATTLQPFAGQVLLIVNTASACGLTPQYKGLQSLYETYKDKGFMVLGFPCNQFAGQEPGTEAEIKQFCELNYQVSFPMFAKVEVNGDNTHPLYKYLKENAPKEEPTGDIEWNFAKFLVDRTGQVVKRYSSRTEPAAIEADLPELLGE
ncbi:glutathione peroxidase [Paenibacillus physcomitrellae]|uniref:Glutathione peroxidase n=1 Tax=Paenibacillus physcomitrellae TaxID=1619311 RepID=A0ABQ1G2X0_9BACL|nr:glutathione peroxidase [Paenibacillus physcomitrellae]GGA36333.1 glutathione peroxidase [Paenibacillus physcomitrellae]